MSPTWRRFCERGTRCLSRLLPILLVAVAALAFTFLTVPISAIAGDGVGQPAGRFDSIESFAGQSVAPHPPAAPPASPSPAAHVMSGWWLLPLMTGLAGLGGLLLVLDRHHCFDELD